MKHNKGLVLAFRQMYADTKNNGTIQGDTVYDFSEELSKLCSKKFDVNNCTDICQSIIKNFLVMLSKKSFGFWEETKDVTENNDARIYKYIESIIEREIYRHTDILYKEKNNIRSHIQKALKKLIASGFLSTVENNHLTLSRYSDNYSLDCKIEDEMPIYFSVFKNNQIDNDKIVSAIETIFTMYLENCAITTSYLKRIILTAIYDFSPIRQIENTYIGEEGEEESVLNNIQDTANTTIEKETEINDFVKIWIDRAKKYLGEENFRTYGKLFLLRYYGNKTLKELSEIFNIKSSTLDNYTKRFVKSMEIENDIPDKDEFTKYSYRLNTELAKELKVTLEAE